MNGAQETTVRSSIGASKVVWHVVKRWLIILKLAWFYAHVDSPSRMLPKYISTILILTIKVQVSATASSKKVSTNKCDIDIAIWLPKPDVLLFPKVWQTSSKFQRQTLQVFDTTSSKGVSAGNSNNDRQPEMASKTRHTYISETMRDSIEIPTANLGFMTM